MQSEHTKNRKCTIFASALFFLFLAGGHGSALAGKTPAVYSNDSTNIFWFIVMSDVHIGARDFPGDAHLEWMVTEGRSVINPSFIVNTGDLTDSSDWNESGYPDGPHAREWQRYREILTAGGVDETFYYDLPGNHDLFGDRDADYFLDYSMQGAATGQTQVSWTRSFDFGTYHFLGINTCGNDGADFSFQPPFYGDHAGLDAWELAYIEAELEAHKDSDLTMIFGHHLIVKRELDWWEDSVGENAENISMTGLAYGADEFGVLMDAYDVLMYGYGHTHDYREEFFTKDMAEGFFYLNVGSLTKSEAKHYNIVAVDNNGVSTVPLKVGVWPAVIITAPLDTNLGMTDNPDTADVLDLTGDAVPIRALVFDKNPVTRVEYKIYKILDTTGRLVHRSVRQANDLLENNSMWHPMTQVSGAHPYYPYLWEADCGYPAAGGDYMVEVRAVGSSMQTDEVPTAFPAEPVNEGGTCFISTIRLFRK